MLAHLLLVASGILEHQDLHHRMQNDWWGVNTNKHHSMNNTSEPLFMLQYPMLRPYLDCQGWITPSSGPPSNTRCSNCSKLVESVKNTREKGKLRGNEREVQELTSCVETVQWVKEFWVLLIAVLVKGIWTLRRWETSTHIHKWCTPRKILTDHSNNCILTHPGLHQYSITCQRRAIYIHDRKK